MHSINLVLRAGQSHQEFRFHGVELQGPCASLRSAGCHGKFVSNMQRDIMRKVTKTDPQQVMVLAKM